MFESGKRHQRGFTLIEMSIVLVIIGLIIGGILKGQELIESARQKNLISQIDQIRSSVVTFTDRYRSFPGDYGQATNNITGCGSNICLNGNDDGILMTGAADTTALMAVNGYAAAVADGATGERWQFFNHLLAADLMGGGSVVTNTALTGYAGGATASPLPQSAYPQSGLDIVYGTHSGTTASGPAVRTNWIRIKRVGATVAAGTEVISPARMFQLDSKYDDGAALAGRIRDSGVDTGCHAAGVNAYTSSDTSVQCHIIVSLE